MYTIDNYKNKKSQSTTEATSHVGNHFSYYNIDYSGGRDSFVSLF